MHTTGKSKHGKQPSMLVTATYCVHMPFSFLAASTTFSTRKKAGLWGGKRKQVGL